MKIWEMNDCDGECVRDMNDRREVSVNVVILDASPPGNWERESSGEKLDKVMLQFYFSTMTATSAQLEGGSVIELVVLSDC